MPVRKTESRIPDTLQPADLGQALVAPDGRCAIVSFVTSPLVAGRSNQYVVFITDAGLGASANSYEWTVTEGAGAPVTSVTQAGELDLLVQQVGSLQITVSIRDAGNAELATLTLAQQAVAPSDELEEMIDDAVDDPGPSMANPDALRELVNEHNLYYQGVSMQVPESGTGFKRMVFNMAFEGVMKRNAGERKRHLEQLALSLNASLGDFATASTQGAGVCTVRLALLAMTLPAMLPWTLLPEETNQRAVAAATLHQSLAQLDENKKVDLFNLVRFPKSNIISCGKILENLRNQYFGTINFNDVLTGMSGARSQWIIAQYRLGPIVRN